MRFNDQVIIVTGGTRGIGRAISLKFAENGAQVIATFQSRRNEAKALVQEAEDRHFSGGIDTVQCSVCDAEKTKQVVRDIKARYGRIDILVNNAGVFTNGYLATMTLKDIDAMIDVNLKGVISTSRAVSRTMIAQRKGQIINISSLSAFRNFEGTAVYAAAKSGIAVFTRCLARELSRYGIVVHGIAPGPVRTEMISDLYDDSETPENRSVFSNVMEPEDIAAWIDVLASKTGTHMRGETLVLGENGSEDY